MVESLGEEDIKRVLTGVSSRAVTTVMSESDRLGEGYIYAHAAGDRCRDLSHLESVRKSGALVVSGEDDDLGLTSQPAKGRRVHYPITITFEAGALVVRLLSDRPISRSFGKSRPGSKRRPLVLFSELSTHYRPRPGPGR
jgi:hypothetical protein